jgi:hypothetical protein
MIRRSFTAQRFILIQPIIIQATRLGWGWHLAQESYWEQRGQTIGAIAIGATATSLLTTITISIETTSIVASKAENGSIMRSIAGALLMETETRLASTVAALDNRGPAELTVPAVPQVSVVERVLAEDQAIDQVAEELEISNPAIVLVEQAPGIVGAAEPDWTHARERGLVPAEAVRMWVLEPVSAPALDSAAVETTLEIAVFHRVRALVRAATLLVAADLAEAPLVPPAVAEAPVWAVADSVAADAQAEAVAAVEAVGGKGCLGRK